MKRKSILRRAPDSLLNNWPYILLTIVGVLIMAALFWYQLGSLTPGMSSTEIIHQEKVASESISLRKTLTEEPLYLPFTLGLYALQTVGVSSAMAVRSIGAFFGVLSGIGFFLLVFKWHTLRVSIFTTVLYVFSAGVLHMARHADVLPVYLLLPVILAIAVHLRTINNSRLQTAFLFLAFAMSLYIPGLIWLALVLFIWQRKRIFTFLKSLRPAHAFALSVLGVSTIGLLLFSFMINPGQLYVWLGVPDALPTPALVLSQAGAVATELFLRGPSNPQMWVGHAAILDVFAVVLFALGSYVYWLKRKLDRTKLLFGSLVILFVLAALGGPVPTFALIPLIYAVAAAGIALLLQQWFSVFPRNPIARSVGIFLVIACISMSIFYNTQRYFVAWAKSPETKSEFRHSL